MDNIGLRCNPKISNMAISRKTILQKIAGRRKAIEYHLDNHIPALIGGADRELIQYWRKEVNIRIAEMEQWAERLSKNEDIMAEAFQYRQRLEELLNKRLNELNN